MLARSNPCRPTWSRRRWTEFRRRQWRQMCTSVGHRRRDSAAIRKESVNGMVRHQKTAMTAKHRRRHYMTRYTTHKRTTALARTIKRRLVTSLKLCPSPFRPQWSPFRPHSRPVCRLGKSQPLSRVGPGAPRARPSRVCSRGFLGASRQTRTSWKACLASWVVWRQARAAVRPTRGAPRPVATRAPPRPSRVCRAWTFDFLRMISRAATTSSSCSLKCRSLPEGTRRSSSVSWRSVGGGVGGWRGGTSSNANSMVTMVRVVMHAGTFSFFSSSPLPSNVS